MPNRRPHATMASDLIISPWARTAAVTKAISMSEKYSGEPNFRAIPASAGPNAAMIIVQTVPAKNEPIAAIASAGPARPWRAI